MSRKKGGHASYILNKTLPQLFEKKVQVMPTHVAISFEKQKLTYHELNKKANQLANYLTKLGVGPEDLVAICLEPSLELIISVLAVLKAGGAYVPLDPNYPRDRIKYILQDTSAILLLTTESISKKFQFDRATIKNSLQKALIIDLDHFNYSKESSKKVSNKLKPDNLAYVVYTSGTTGNPKGVMVTHKNLINIVKSSQDIYVLSSNDRIGQYASFAFDVFNLDWTSALLTGASLHIVPAAYRKDMDLLSQWIRSEEITVIDLPTAIFHLLSDEQLLSFSSLRLLKIGGEALRYLPAVNWKFQLIDTYGPSETTVECMMETHTPFSKKTITL